MHTEQLLETLRDRAEDVQRWRIDTAIRRVKMTIFRKLDFHVFYDS